MSRLALLEDAAAFPDGSWVTARQIVRSDGRHVSQFIGQMSEESEYLQFLSSSGNQKTVWVPRLINADQVDHLAYGAFASDRFGSSLVAIAESIRYRDRSDWAEFAIVSSDRWQGMGVGTLLTRHLASRARSTGIRYWEALMLSENRRMERLLARVGTEVATRAGSGLVTTVRDISSLR